MSARRSSRRGLTLVELLAALALLSLVVSVSSAWTIGVVRAGRAVIESNEIDPALDRALRLLAGDLDEALADPALSGRRDAAVCFGVEQSEIVVVRAGDGSLDPAGWHRVTWRLDPKGELLRESIPAGADASAAEVVRRVALRGVKRFDIVPIEARDDARPTDGAHPITRSTTTATKSVVGYELRIELRRGDLRTQQPGPAAPGRHASRRLRWEVAR